MASIEHRTGNNNMARSGIERRVNGDLNYKGPERRNGRERRSGPGMCSR